MSTAPSVHASLDSPSFDTAGLHVSRVRGQEQIGCLFEFLVDLVTADDNHIARADLLGRVATLRLEGSGEARAIHGMIAAVEERLDLAGGKRALRVTLVPRAQRLTLIKTQDVHVDVSVPDIIAHKLERVGLHAGEDMDVRLAAKYPPRDFVLQYAETDLAFVSRLAEHLGLSFFFEHHGGVDRLVLTDQSHGFAPLAGEPLAIVGASAAEGITQLSVREKLIPEEYAVMDYNYRLPQLELTVSERARFGFAGGVAEYGGHFKSDVEGRALARVRAEEGDATQMIYEGESTVPGLSAGHVFKVEGAGSDQVAELLCVSVEHRAAQVVPGDTAAPGGYGYANSFVAIPADRTYRPPRRTPRPRIHGVLSGLVEPDQTFEVGREAKLDEFGRYRVKLIFDTAPLGERKASHPVRMAQPHVGPDHGMHFPLRPGVEVLLAFVEGDPDRPVIVGAVHNMATPDHITGGTPRTNSIKTASGISVRFVDG